MSTPLPYCLISRALTREDSFNALIEQMRGPIDKWVLMLLKAGAKVRNLGDVRWCATEDGSTGKGTGRHIAAFILEGKES